MSGKLGTNAIYNVIGMIGPVAVSIFTVPLYLHAVGEARFGILSLIWLIFGYFGLFDFGLSRAVTNRLAQLTDAVPQERNAVFYTALLMNAVLGLIGAIVFYIAMIGLLRFGFGFKPVIVSEIYIALPWISALVPLALVGGVFVGSLEASEQFFTLSVRQTVGSVLLQCLPLASVLIFSPTVEYAVIGAIVARVVSIIWVAIAALRSMKSTGRPEFRASLVWPLLKYGGGVTVSNVIGPILVSVDQLVISTLLGATALAHYVVPFNLSIKALILPEALSRSMFPRLSKLQGDAAVALAERASEVLAGLMAFVCVPAILLSKVMLTVWLGDKFSVYATPVAQLLFVGTWITGVAFVPLALLMGQGRPYIVAKFHAFELIPFVGLLWFSVYIYGLPGAAFSWCSRAAVDAILLFAASGVGVGRLKSLFLAGLCVVFAWFVAVYCQPSTQLAFAIAFAINVGISVWLVGRNEELRKWIVSFLQNVRLLNRGVGR